MGSALQSSCFVLIAIISAIFQQPVLAKYCSFWDTDCVSPYAQTAVSFSFQPLYPDDLSLYYGYDSSYEGSSGLPVTKTSFWLRYGGNRINSSAIDANRTSEIAMRVGNLTGSPAGGNNGCDGVWGADCSRVIIEKFKDSIYGLSISGTKYTNPLETVLNQMMFSPPSSFSCAPYFFDVQSFPFICRFSPSLHAWTVVFGYQIDAHYLFPAFASEYIPPQTVAMHNSGSSSGPWKTWFINDMSAGRQADEVAVAIISRSPVYGWPPLASKDEVQIELVCIQAPS